MTAFTQYKGRQASKDLEEKENHGQLCQVRRRPILRSCLAAQFLDKVCQFSVGTKRGVVLPRAILLSNELN